MVTQKTHQVLTEWISNGKQFTAYDVTKEVRVRVGRGVNVRHEDVKALVHAEFETLAGLFDADYSRTLIQVANPTPWLYYPVSSDPNDYLTAIGRTDILLDFSTNSSTVPSADDGIQSPSVSDAGVTRVVTDEGRLNIPVKLIDKIGPTCGSYDITVDGNTQCAKLNGDGRIRITAYTAGTKVSIKADKDKNCIVVTKAN